MDAEVASDDGVGRDTSSPPRLRRPDRAQVLLEPVCLENRLPLALPVCRRIIRCG